MRIFIANFILICALLSMALAQQTDSTKDQTNQKKPEAQAQKDKKAPDNAPKPPDATAFPQPKPDAAKDSSSDKDKEEHYDMTEIAPVATHHQITLDGKVLSTQRLRGDFRSSATMARSKLRCSSLLMPSTAKRRAGVR